MPIPDKIIEKTASQSDLVGTPFRFLANRMPENAR